VLFRSNLQGCIPPEGSISTPNPKNHDDKREKPVSSSLTNLT
jgi:hypothetical protein